MTGAQADMVNKTKYAFVCKLRLYTSDKVEYGSFWHSRASNSKMTSLILPEFEHIRDFIPIHVICKFRKVSIKGERNVSCKYVLE